MVVEYSLKVYTNPIGVANWEKDIESSLPKDFEGILPINEQIEVELDNIEV